MNLSLIWAQTSTGIIGDRGGLPWHLPEDLAHFRRLTSGSAVIMGRTTWESLPEKFRPLPNRKNIVLTRQENWQATGAHVVPSVVQALAEAGDNAWGIGGAAVYEALLPHADRIERTVIDLAVTGDRSAPDLGRQWHLVAVDPPEGWHTAQSGIRYRFETHQRDANGHRHHDRAQAR